MQRSLAFLVLTVLVLAVFAQSYRFQFLNFDDQLVVTHNPMVLAGMDAQTLHWAWTTGHFANWMPLTWMSHQLDVELFGDWAGGHHLTSVTLHWLSALLLFDALWRMTGRWGASLVVAGLWAVHPLHVESIAWISERKGILSSLFWMLAIRLYACYGRRPSVRSMALVAAAMILGLLAKQMLVTLPLALLLLDIWPLNRWDGRRKCLTLLIAEKIPLFAVAMIFSIIAYLFQSGGEAVANFDELPLRYRLANAVVSTVLYLRRVFWPSDLAVFYPHPLDQFAGPDVLLSTAILLILTLTALVVYKRWPFVTVGWFWYLATLAPVVGFIQVGSHGMADRYSDIPLVGIYIALVWGATSILIRFAAPAWLRSAMAFAILTMVALASMVQASYWRTSYTLFERVLAVDPDNYMAMNQLGALAEEQGDLTTAAEFYANSIDVHDGFRIAHANLGRVLMQMGNTPGGLMQWAIAAELGDPVAAEQLRGRAVAIDPDDQDYQGLVGQVLSDLGQHQQALPYLENAVARSPNSAIAHQRLAAAKRRVGDFNGARDEFVTACSMNPAILGQLEAASEAKSHSDPFLLDILAACQSRVDSMDKAVATMNKAIEIARQNKLDPVLPAFEERLKQYQQAVPYSPME